MFKLNISGTLGKYGYSKLPDAIKSEIIKLALDQAYIVAKQKAPVLPEHPIHIKDEIRKEYIDGDTTAYLVVESPYAFPAEFGSKKRYAHPFFRPAFVSAKNKIRNTLRKIVKSEIAKEKLKSGS